MIPVYDLHCDLLAYLEEGGTRGVYDPISRCSYPDLSKGGVQMQTLAIYVPTSPHSVASGLRQVDLFGKLLQQHPLEFHPHASSCSKGIGVIAALENGSSFALEEEPLEKCFQRLATYIQKLAPLFYVSLTWNTENRFGGGNETKIGLKEDGKRLLEFLDGKRIAIDLSHTSDPLAYDIINWIDKKSLALPLIASHSNYRTVSNWPRNLPEELAKELMRRKGIIGLNLVAPFIHNSDPHALFRHIEYALSLGGEDSLCFGADFFYAEGEALRKKYNRDSLFYPDWSNASCYPSILEQMRKYLHLSQEQIGKIFWKNASHFLEKNIL